jgi:hypothetical protein
VRKLDLGELEVADDLLETDVRSCALGGACERVEGGPAQRDLGAKQQVRVGDREDILWAAGFDVGEFDLLGAEGEVAVPACAEATPDPES